MNNPQPPEDLFDWNSKPDFTQAIHAKHSPRLKRIQPLTSTKDATPNESVLDIIQQYPAHTKSSDFDKSRFSSACNSFSPRVISVLEADLKRRTKDDLSFLQEFCKRCQLFHHLDEDEIRILLDAADLIEYCYGDRIFSDGDDCDLTDNNSFTYLIIEGTVSLCGCNSNVDTNEMSEILSQSQSCIQAVSTDYLAKGEYIIASLGPASHFGRINLTSTSRTISSLVSSKICQLMRIPLKSFSEAVSHHRKIHKNDIYQTLEQAHCCINLTKPQIAKLALHAKLKTFGRNEMVFQQGTPTTGVAIVKSGTFRILQKRGGQIIEVAIIAKGECWGYKSLLRVPKVLNKKSHLQQDQRTITKSKRLWLKLSSALNSIYSTSLISHKGEGKSELVWISSSEWRQITKQNPKMKANLTFSVLLDHKKSAMEEREIQTELAVTENKAKISSHHVTFHAKG
jgi:CRP-like cAMP-binding protein